MTVQVPDRAAGQQQCRERECISVHNPLQAGHTRTEALADLRQRDIDDRHVQQNQEVADAHHEQYQSA